MIKKLKRILSLLFICLITNLLGQQMYFRNISNSLNLPSPECYSLIQDSKGYIWICTENGLVKTSGYNQKTYDKLNGLTEGSVYFIKEGKDGSINLLTSTNRLLKIKNDIIKADKTTSIIQSYIKNYSTAKHLTISYFLNYDIDNNLLAKYMP